MSARGHGAAIRPAARPYSGNRDVPDDVFADVLRQVSSFVRDRVVPRETEIMNTDRIPDDLRDAAAGMGLFGYAIP
jgi:acyl-CoA dehydrogenase